MTTEGQWDYSNESGIFAGQVPSDVFAELVSATASTEIGSAPPRESPPFDAELGQTDLVYTWRDAGGSIQSASAVEREIGGDDDLVEMLLIVLDEWATASEPEDVQRARGTAVVAAGLVGRAEEEATSLLGALASTGLAVRVIKRDGLPPTAGDDRSPLHVDLTIEHRYVSAAKAG